MDILTNADLLKPADKLKRFALKLTGNSFDADDLYQSTYLIMLEKIRNAEYFKNVEAYMFGVMKFEYLRMFIIKKKIYRKNCAFEDWMSSVVPEQESIATMIDVQKLIDRNPEYNQQMLYSFLSGETWPKLRKATKDFIYLTKQQVQ